MDDLKDSSSVAQSGIEDNDSKSTPSPVKSQTHSPAPSYLSSRVETPERNDSGAEDTLVNPPPPEELGEDECALLRGDAIGKTAYTQRWVLNTLLVITQALPYYLTPEAEPVPGASGSDRANGEESKSMDTEESQDQVKVTPNCDEERPTVVELADDVESAACQLWDMTVEPDVVLHLLDLNVIDILQLATEIITLSRAPRLTEVVVGVVANLSCQEEGCKRIISHQTLLNACLALPQMTDDVPTLVEDFRFMRLLLWHLNHRVPQCDRVGCPLVMTLKGHESLKVALVFILKNSLSETLLSSVLQFLEILMYLWLPEDKCYMAAHYAESGLAEGIVEVMRHFLKLGEKNGSQELPKEVHMGVLILYSFVGTPASHMISSFDQYESLLEPILICYVENIAKVESTEELLEDENVERLTYALGLYELLVPTMRHPNIMSSVGKLLVLTHGANYHHGTPLRKVMQGTPQSISNRRPHRKFRRSRSRRSRSSQEQMETEATEIPPVSDQNSGKEQQKGEQTNEGGGPDLRGHSSNDAENFKILPSCDPVSGTSAEVACDGQGREASAATDMDVNHKNTYIGKLNSLMESLIDYCTRVVKYSSDLFAVLSALNECHVHEVQFFFRAVRSREPKLVGDIQEKLLDTGSHNRLVTILADMYS